MKNRIIVGADEAGYGPNLGPLLVVATAWSVPVEMETEAFSDALKPVFQMRHWSPGCSHVPLGDSKQLYQPSVGLASLEAGLLALMHDMDARGGSDFANNLQTFKQLVEWPRATIDSEPEETNAIAPWYEQLEQWPVPVFHSGEEIARLAELVQTGLQSHSIQLLGCRAAIITESQFNASVAASGSKGQLLSATTLNLVRSFCVDEPQSVTAFCDRQGGRKNYLPVLLEAMPDNWFIETLQSPTRCSYRNTTSPLREFHFTVGGDSFAPTALASMLAKYLRERLMHSFNEFWRSHVPGIKATAGYPLDAKRFREAIEPVAQELELDESMWWRCR